MLNRPLRRPADFKGLPTGEAATVAWSATVLAVLLIAPPAAAASPHSNLTFRPSTIPAPSESQYQGGSSDGTEPRVAVGRSGVIWTVISPGLSEPRAQVWRSSDDGRTFTQTRSEFPGQHAPITDVDIAALRTGRLVAIEEDSGNAVTGNSYPPTAPYRFEVGYSDNGGNTWRPTSGTELVDEDRPWLAEGPIDPATHQPIVYLTFHNIFSGVAAKNMFVQTSHDGGASFGSPVPITLPGQEAFTALQCGATTGPSALFVNEQTGQIYVVFETSSGTIGALGGCGTAIGGTVPGQFFAPYSRMWVATSRDGSLGSWTQSLAVDDSATQQIIGSQLADGALDSFGNIWVVYPETPGTFPHFEGAAVRVRWATADLSHWSAPITIAPRGGAGHLLTHIAAGDAGKIDVAYLTGHARKKNTPVWRLEVAQVLDGLRRNPTVVRQQVSSIPAYTGKAGQLEVACNDAGAASGVMNQEGVTACATRAADVWGRTLTPDCRLVVAWPSAGRSDLNNAPGAEWATHVSVQVGGPRLCAAPSNPSRVGARRRRRR